MLTKKDIERLLIEEKGLQLKQQQAAAEAVTDRKYWQDEVLITNGRIRLLCEILEIPDQTYDAQAQITIR